MGCRRVANVPHWRGAWQKYGSRQSRHSPRASEDTASPSPQRLRPANGVAPRIAMHAGADQNEKKAVSYERSPGKVLVVPCWLCCVTAESLVANLPVNASSSPVPTETI